MYYKISNILIFLLVMLFCINDGFTQSNGDYGDENTLPTVFLLGEYEDSYETLLMDHATHLLKACSDDMVVAHEKWMSMLQEMEAYALQVDYNLKGIKMWIHVFWDNNGNLDHIAYYLKPESRNVPTADLSEFLTGFSTYYQFPLNYEHKFAYYGSAAFPTIPLRLGDK